MPAQPHVLLALSSYDYRIHRGVARYAGEHRWHLNSDMCIWGRLPRGWQGDGIITALDSQPALVRFVRDAGVPVVDLSINRPELPYARIAGDNRRIGALAAEHFLERGFRHFAWHANDTSPAAELRWDGYAAALRQAGGKPERWIWRAGSRRPDDVWRAKCLWLVEKLRAIPKPAAVFAFRDIDAASVLDACLSDEVRVPDEVGLLGVDNNDLICETQSVPLSSVHHDLDTLGYEGARLLDLIMRGGASPAQPLLIPPRGLVARRSTEVLAVNNETCRQAIRFLQDNLGRNIGVADAVRHTGHSRRALEKAMRENLGRSPGQELARLRLAKVRELLATTRLTVAAISALAGYTTPQYLNHTFRKVVGMTPGQYRRANRPLAAGGTQSPRRPVSGRRAPTSGRVPSR